MSTKPLSTSKSESYAPAAVRRPPGGKRGKSMSVAPKRERQLPVEDCLPMLIAEILSAELIPNPVLPSPNGR